jgi:hypothetical protein
MDGGLGELKKQSQPPGISKGGSSPPGITKASPSSKIGIGITKASPSSKIGISKTTPSSNSTQQPPGINMESYSSKIYPGFRPGKKLTNAPKPEQEKVKKVLTPEQKHLKDSVKPLSLENAVEKVNREAEKGKTEPIPEASVTGQNAVAFGTAMLANISTALVAGAKHGIKEFPIQLMKIIDEAKSQTNGLSITKKPLTERPMKKKSMTGGIISKIRFNKTLFMTLYLPAILTLFAFAFLLFYLLLTLIQWVLNKITKAFGSDKKTLPTIKFNKKTTQTVYSIFFVITSWFLMFYLFIDYFGKLGPELDIVQIFKQLVGASYILWPMSVLIIGSGISKAFYKISCNGNKPNVQSWAKIVESSALYVLGISVLITLILLFKPVVWIYNRFPQIMKDKFTYVDNLLAVTLKLMVIYILLRMVTVMLEDIISNKLVFFISKLNKDIEPPPVDCNVEEKKTAKQSEMARMLEEIYMYISGIIVCIIAIFILVIQCPHPYMISTSRINHTAAAVVQRLTSIATRYIVQNKDRKVGSGNKKTGSGVSFSSLLSGNKNEVAPSDSTAEAYIGKFKAMAAADNAGTASQTSATLVSEPAPPVSATTVPQATTLETILPPATTTQQTKGSGEYKSLFEGIPNLGKKYESMR